MESIDLTNLNLAEIRDIALQYLMSLKKTQKDLQKVNEDMAAWQHRKELAQKTQRDDLFQVAQEKYDELRARSTSLEMDVMELESEVHRIQQQLEQKAQHPDGRQDTHALLEHISGILGPDYELEESLRTLETEDSVEKELSRLQQQVQNDSDTRTGK